MLVRRKVSADSIEFATPERSVVVNFAKGSGAWSVTVGGASWFIGELRGVQSFTKGYGRIEISRRALSVLKSRSLSAKLLRRSAGVEDTLATVIHISRADAQSFEENPASPVQVWMTIIIPVVASLEPQVIFSDAIPDYLDPESFFGPELWMSGYGVSAIVLSEVSPGRKGLGHALFSQSAWRTMFRSLAEPKFLPFMLPLVGCYLAVYVFACFFYVGWTVSEWLRRALHSTLRKK